MAGTVSSRVFPFAAGGAAAGTLLQNGAVALTDLTAQPRFGIKGRGCARWITSQGIDLPGVNRISDSNGMRCLRLGEEDFLFLGAPDGDALGRLTAAWAAASVPRGYASLRDEGWAWMRLAGPRVADAMARLCALDLREGKFGGNAIAQTRVGQLEAVLFRGESGFDIFFDITASAYFSRTVDAVARQIGMQDHQEDPS